MLQLHEARAETTESDIQTEVCRFQDGDAQRWDDYVARCPESSHCHLSGWRRIIMRSYGHRTYYFWSQNGSEVTGVLPLVAMRSLFFSRSLVSLPFLDDGGICADDEQVRSQLSLAALQLYHEHKADFLDLRHRHLNSLGFPLVSGKSMMILELTPDSDGMWNRFDAKLRNQIRKAIKSGLTAAWSGKEGLADFYEVFAANMRDLGSPVHSRKFFEAILDEFSATAKIMLVRKNERVIGAALCLFFKDTMIVPWASSLREFFSLCPNNLLYWEMIQWGCQNGYRRFDFGRSSPTSGTYRFKKQWGTKEEPLHWQCLSRKNGQAAVPHADDPKYQWLINTWSHLPLSLTKVVGPAIRGQISS